MHDPLAVTFDTDEENSQIEAPGMNDAFLGIIIVLAVVTSMASSAGLIHQKRKHDAEARQVEVASRVVVGPGETISVDGRQVADLGELVTVVKQRLAAFALEKASEAQPAVTINPYIGADWQTFWQARLGLDNEGITWQEGPPLTHDSQEKKRK